MDRTARYAARPKREGNLYYYVSRKVTASLLGAVRMSSHSRQINWVHIEQEPERSEVQKQHIWCGAHNIYKHCKRHNRLKALSTLTQSTPLGLSRSFNIVEPQHALNCKSKLIQLVFWQRAKNA